MSDKKKIRIDDEQLEQISGGNSNAPSNMMVHISQKNGYLGLRATPSGSAKEMARLFNADVVETYGSTTPGTDLAGKPCTYVYVGINGTWGWANSSFLGID